MPRRKQYRETDAVAAAAVRMTRAIGRRIADGEVESLVELERLRTEVDEQMRAAVAALVDPAGPWSYSYTDVARVLGVSRQAARQRFTR
jgi:hypothetical protein